MSVRCSLHRVRPAHEFSSLMPRCRAPFRPHRNMPIIHPCLGSYRKHVHGSTVPRFLCARVYVCTYVRTHARTHVAINDA